MNEQIVLANFGISALAVYKIITSCIHFGVPNMANNHHFCQIRQILPLPLYGSTPNFHIIYSASLHTHLPSCSHHDYQQTSAFHHFD